MEVEVVGEVAEDGDEIHGAYTARHTIFAAALAEAADHSPAARNVVDAAIRRHMATAA